MAFHPDPCSPSLLLTFSFLSSPRLPSTAPVLTPARLSPLRTAPHHLRTSSAKVLLFWCFPSVNLSCRQANGKGLNVDATSTGNGSLGLVANLTTVTHSWYMPFTSLLYFSGTHCLSCTNTELPSWLFPDQINEHTVYVLLSFSVAFVQLS